MFANFEDEPNNRAAGASASKSIWRILFVLAAVGITLLVARFINAPSSSVAPFPAHPYMKF